MNKNGRNTGNEEKTHIKCSMLARDEQPIALEKREKENAALVCFLCIMLSYTAIKR